jgi:hypothetical protein
VVPHFGDVGLQEMSKNILNSALKVDSTKTNFDREKISNLNKELRISKSQNGGHLAKRNLTLKIPKNSLIKKQPDQNNMRENLFSEKFFNKRTIHKNHEKGENFVLPLIHHPT